MKKLLLITTCLCYTLCTYAQQYKWLKGGGSIVTPSIAYQYDQISYICTDSNKNVYIAAVVGNTDILADTFHRDAHNTGGSEEALIASYSCDGTMRWAKLVEALNYTNLYGLEYSNGNIYIIGNMVGNNKYIGDSLVSDDEFQNKFTAQFDTSGNLKWLTFIGKPDSITDLYSAQEFSSALKIDGQGYIHHFAYINSGIALSSTLRTPVAGTYDMKYDTSGNLLSAKLLQIDSGWLIRSVAINQNNGNVYASIHWGPDDIPPGYVAEFDTSGNQLWADSVGGSLNVIPSLVYDEKGSLYCAGDAELTPFILGGDTVNESYASGYLGVIFKMDTAGHMKWTFDVNFNSSGGNFYELTLLPNGKVAAVGTVAGLAKHNADSINSGSVYNPLLVVVDTVANLVTLDQLYGDGFYNYGMVITSDSFNNIYIGGEEANDLTAGSYTYTTHGGNSDFFVTKYGYNCDCTLDSIPTSGFTYSGGSTTTISFTFTGTASADSVVWDFGNGSTATGTSPTYTYASSGVYHVCATVYTGCGTTTSCQEVSADESVASLAAFGNVQVYPNPVSNQLIIQGAGTGTKVRVLNILGQQVYSGTITNDKTVIQTGDWSVGTYTLQLTGTDGRHGGMTVVKE